MLAGEAPISIENKKALPKNRIFVRRVAVIAKKVLQPGRVRAINGSFAFIEHRFVRDGFWEQLSHQELILYFFLILAADRQGVSFYSFARICRMCAFADNECLAARNGLIAKDLLAFDGQFFQILSLPHRPVPATDRDEREEDSRQLSEIMRKWLQLQGEEHP